MSQHPQHQTQAAGRKEGQPPPLASTPNLHSCCFLKPLPLSPSLFSLVTDARRPGPVGRGSECRECGLVSLAEQLCPLSLLEGALGPKGGKG